MKKNTKVYFSVKYIFLSIVLVCSFFIFFSLILQKIGDTFLTTHDIRQAHFFYSLSNILNPLNSNAQNRLVAVRVIEEEHKGDSEETAIEDTKEIAQNIVGKSVLGTNITLPVLMYHYIRVNPYPDDKVGFNLSVTPYNFNAQMDYLQLYGYTPISLEEFENALLHNGVLPEKPILITLDDGYKDAYTQAFPILKSHKFKAVDFVITGFVGLPIYLTWDQIEEMNSSGVFTFASHTVHHAALTYLSEEHIKNELTESRKDLKLHLKQEIKWFAYPYGNVNDKVVKILPLTGYVGAFGTNRGAFHAIDIMYTLPRIRIGGRDSVESFASKIP